MPRPKPRNGPASWSAIPVRRLRPSERRALFVHIEADPARAAALYAEVERLLFAWYPGAIRAARSAPDLPSKRGRPRRDELVFLIRGLRQVFHRFSHDRGPDDATRSKGGNVRAALSPIEAREQAFVQAALDVAHIPYIGAGRSPTSLSLGDMLGLETEPTDTNTVRRYFAAASSPFPETRAMRIAAIVRKVNKHRR